ncbi:MAG: ion channel [Verrucomicrobiota bacterium]
MKYLPDHVKIMNGLVQRLLDWKYSCFFINILIIVFLELANTEQNSQGGGSFFRRLFLGVAMALIAYPLLKKSQHRLFMLAFFVLVSVFVQAAYFLNREVEVTYYYIIHIAAVLRMSFMLLVLILIIRDILSKKSLVSDDVMGALSVYLMFGLLFADAYISVLALDPESTLSIPFEQLKIGDIYYFSYITLSTIGYGDITPVSPIARALTILEGVIGVMFLATMVAKVVSEFSVHKE